MAALQEGSTPPTATAVRIALLVPQATPEPGPKCHVLEVGAGHRIFTEVLTRPVRRSTSQKMSEPSVKVLTAREIAGINVEIV